MTWDLATHAGQTRAVLATCREVLAGDLDASALTTALAPHEKVLQEQLLAFVSQGQAQPEAWQPLVLATSEAYGACVRALGQPEAKALEDLFTRLEEALAYCEARVLIEGPSPYPVQNVLRKAADAARAGTMPPEGFVQLVQAARSQFEASAEAVGVPTAQAFTACVDALRELERFGEDGDPSHLDEGLSRLESAQAAVDEATVVQAHAQMAQGPTSSPVANAFIAAAGMLEAGKFDSETFRVHLDHLDEHVRQMRRAVEASRGTGGHAATLSDPVEVAVIKHEAAVASWKMWFQDGDVARLRDGVTALTEGVALMDAARQELEGAPLKTVLCPHCGATNAGGASECAQCGKTLPRVRLSPATGAVETETGDPNVVLTDHMMRVIGDVNRMASGAISRQEFRATLEWMAGLALQTERQLLALPSVDVQSFAEEEREQAQQVSRLVDETRELLAGGTQQMRASLEELAAYADDTRMEHLSDGLRMFWEACRVVYQAQRVGEMGALRLSPHQVRVAAAPDDEDSFNLLEESPEREPSGEDD